MAWQVHPQGVSRARCLQRKYAQPACSIVQRVPCCTRSDGPPVRLLHSLHNTYSGVSIMRQQERDFLGVTIG